MRRTRQRGWLQLWALGRSRFGSLDAFHPQMRPRTRCWAPVPSPRVMPSCCGPVPCRVLRLDCMPFPHGGQQRAVAELLQAFSWTMAGRQAIWLTS